VPGSELIGCHAASRRALSIETEMLVKVVVARGSLARLEEAQSRWQGRVSFVETELDSPEQIQAATGDADGVIVALQRLSVEEIEALGAGVKVIGRAGVGLDAIDLQAARGRGIAVINQPSYATAEVATHAVSMALAVHRRLVKADAVARAGWGLASDVGTIGPLDEATAGVIGAGKIGSAALERLRPFVGRLLAYDPGLDHEIAGVEVVDSLTALLEESDLVSLHAPLIPATRHMIDAAAIAGMKPGAVLVNVSRGGLIDEDALATALHDATIGGAALDVFEAEPLPGDSPLFGAPNLLLSPHLAWYSSASAIRLATWTSDDVAKSLHGDHEIDGNVANL
jgi:D-3-phosphoglycerate dehydrogenase / 2-oxoglutarate reductase